MLRLRPPLSRLAPALLTGLLAATPLAARAQAVRTLPGLTAGTLQANDDGSTGLDGGVSAVSLGLSSPLNFFGATYSSVYVNNNGNVTFAAPLRTFTPFGLTTSIGTPIIAPFFADVDSRGPSHLGSGSADGNAGNVAQAFDGSGLVTYGGTTVDGRAAFGVNWFSDCGAWTGAGAGPDCAAYASTGGLVGTGYFSGHADRLNVFQLLLIDRSDVRAGDFDIEFNYNQVQWETGDASQGVGGLGGLSARAGFSNGTGAAGTFFELDGSGNNGAFLDGGPAGTTLVRNSRSSDVLGRYVFAVRNGRPDIISPEPSTWLLLGAGLLALAAVGARQRRAVPV